MGQRIRDIDPRNTKPGTPEEKARKRRAEYPNCAINSVIFDTGIRSTGAGSGASGRDATCHACGSIGPTCPIGPSHEEDPWPADP
jgi:hypothetical protein